MKDIDNPTLILLSIYVRVGKYNTTYDLVIGLRALAGSRLGWVTIDCTTSVNIGRAAEHKNHGK